VRTFDTFSHKSVGACDLSLASKVTSRGFLWCTKSRSPRRVASALAQRSCCFARAISGSTPPSRHPGVRVIGFAFLLRDHVRSIYCISAAKSHELHFRDAARESLDAGAGEEDAWGLDEPLLPGGAVGGELGSSGEDA